MKIWVVAAILAAMGVLRWRKASLFTWTLAWWAGFYVAVRFGFKAPIPSSVIAIYMGIVTISILAYVTSSAERRAAISRPLVELIVAPRRRPLLVAVVLLLPALAAANVYFRMSVPLEAPLFARTVHPASPTEITVHDRKIDLDAGVDPYWELEKTDPEEFKVHLANGRRVYYRNCHFCHGDNMTGNGMFAHGVNPVPTNFADGTIAGLRDTFLFWRISKGGPGLPEEAGPWDSVMPAWEKMLTEEEMWDVILFLYDLTGQKPRAKEHHAEGEPK